MDLALYVRVLWRFRLLVSFGLILALALAVLSVVRFSSGGLAYREPELWSSTTRLLVTQKGFPEGRLYAQQPLDEAQPSSPVVDPGRFNNLAVLYANLATSDPVRRLIAPGGRIEGEIVAIPVVAGGEFKTQLPLIDLTAVSTSAGGAIALAQRSAAALATYIRHQQQASDVPVADRAVIEQLVQPRKATVFQPRSRTMPVVVFLAVMFVTVGLAFLLENLRPRPREVDGPVQPSLRETVERRTA